MPMTMIYSLFVSLLVVSTAEAARYGLLRIADPASDRAVASGQQLHHESSRTLFDEDFALYVANILSSSFVLNNY
jgi:hypothetical protein